ncbi:flagellar basal body P-ring formation chaperone FlgA [Actibacterium ureilyticum]|uniref:flagellar basal body P-ring formation chaperone FlgA n=1 Tax=Actibacterium ureilyticum TaxID=1590614 RepID=UPI000BAABD1C|nr:flagellar basal body P-ring formation chaperone FlgA [Actibacterium ureilyticum]
MRWICLIAALMPQIVRADVVVATRNIRSQTVLVATDMQLVDQDLPGALQRVDTAVGLEARVNLYVGRPIHPGDLAPPALVERNQIVSLLYRRGGLQIATEGRTLERAGKGEVVKAMNLASRTIVTGTVLASGQVVVTPQSLP